MHYNKHMLLIHIIIALSSVIFASALLVRPTQRKMYVNYAFIVATIATGTDLVLTTHVDMLHTCVSGLAYLSVVAALSIMARYRLLSHTTANE